MDGGEDLHVTVETALFGRAWRGMIDWRGPMRAIGAHRAPMTLRRWNGHGWRP